MMMSTAGKKNEIERELHRQKTEALELQNRMERSRLAAAAQPDRPAFSVQYPERHPADGGYRVRLPHASVLSASIAALVL